MIGERDNSAQYVHGLEKLDYVAIASISIVTILLVTYVFVTQCERANRAKWIVVSLMVLVFIIDLVILFLCEPERRSTYNISLLIIDIFAFVFAGKMLFVKTYMADVKTSLQP